MYKFSIIIPVYNNEKYIKDCVNSWLRQTYKNFELILIDDGSTDRSYSILKELKKLDSRIIVKTQKNQGASSARNAGLDIARGEIIGFCDADDCVSSVLLETVNDNLKKKDVSIVQTSHSIDKSKLTQSFENKTKIISLEKFRREVLFDYNVMGSVWNKFFPWYLLKEYRFNTKLSYCEDKEFLIRVIEGIKIGKVAQIKEPLYFYNQGNDNAATSSKNYSRQVDKNGRSKYLESDYTMYNESSNSVKRLIKSVIYSDSVANLGYAAYGVIISDETKKELVSNIRSCFINYYFNRDISLKDKLKCFINYLKYRNC